jgi:hypothetical protein
MNAQDPPGTGGRPPSRSGPRARSAVRVGEVHSGPARPRSPAVTGAGPSTGIRVLDLSRLHPASAGSPAPRPPAVSTPTSS